MRLLVASFNPGKLAELREVITQYAAAAGLALELAAPGDLGMAEPVAETGATYAENAALKAQVYARAAGLVALGDDSGLEVDALGGAPGLYTARYAGPGASDAARRALLLASLQDVPDERRAARFRCAIAIATPTGATWLTEGTVEGRITRAEAGGGGFGYDPVFFVPEFDCTMAELPAEVKNTISHRARAVAAAIPLLARLG
jgi:XTP/dITP diphosphohydrolase